MLTLENFEKHVNEIILKRGKQYYQNGAVITVEETEENIWEAEITGSEVYTVEVTLNNKSQISQYCCDCPYDGETCKHAVAVFFAIREIKALKPEQTQPSQKKAFDNLLQQISLKEYQEFIRQHALKDKNFKTAFQLWFADKDAGIDVDKKYADLIVKLIRKHTDRNFVDYWAARALSIDVDKLLDAGYDLVHKKNFKDAFALAKPALKEMMKAITYCDDSDGDIGETINHAIRLLDTIVSSKEAAIDLQELVFNFLQTELIDKLYFDYGDFGYELFTVFQKISARLNKAEAFLSFVDIQISRLTGKYDDSRRDYFHRQKIEFLKAIGEVTEAEKLILQNMDIVEVRQGEINKAIEKKEFNAAKNLISEGIKIAEKKEHAGTVSKWEKELLRIAVLEKDTQKIRHYTLRFAFDRWFDKEYYTQWKQSYSTMEWKVVIEEYIEKQIVAITRQHNKNKDKIWYSDNPPLLHSLAPIYIEEKYWDRLLALVRKENSLETIWQYHEDLAREYPFELLEIYLPLFELEGDKANSRSEYAYFAGKMKKIIKDIPKGKEKIIAIAQKLKQKYPRRPAMIDELNKILK